ncbi:MAG TPA: protease complex subunit PrcB family protein [Candidatus Limnocylindria bacterium]|nr:protease complex subunit PrcB family protein [Candidatus Limnocylindria bacterium]
MVLVACGSTAGSGGVGGAVTRDVPFADVAYVAYGRHDTGPAIVVGANDQWRAVLARLVDGSSVPDGRVAVAAFQGEQRSGGFSIKIERIQRTGDQLIVHAKFSEPAPGSMNTMALTSPVHVVSIAAADAKDLKLAVLLDETGTERAKATLA